MSLGEKLMMIVFSLITGRAPNTKRLNLESAGVELDGKTGAVKVGWDLSNFLDLLFMVYREE